MSYHWIAGEDSSTDVYLTSDIFFDKFYKNRVTIPDTKVAGKRGRVASLTLTSGAAN